MITKEEMKKIQMRKDAIVIDPKPVHAIDLDIQNADTESDLDKSFRELFSAENLEKKSHLSKVEIRKLAILKTYADKFGFVELKQMILEFMSMRVSYKRYGRKEAVEIAKAERIHNEMMLQENKHISSDR